jgi:ParB family chromosome partitioning protein
MSPSGERSKIASVSPKAIEKNPNNPRRYFNEERLDLLRTSIQEVGVLVPLIAYRAGDRYVLMDGERRWRSALDLGVEAVPVNLIPEPDPLENLLQMFNIHSVREEWPLISVAVSLQEVIEFSGEERESRLAEMTGLTRSTVRRAKRLLSLPKKELDLIERDAHLDRADQVHREDLYLEIEAAVSVVRNELPEVAERYSRPQMIRAFARKREAKALVAVTEFRDVAKIVKAVDEQLVTRKQAVRAIGRLVENVELTPSVVFGQVAQGAYEQRSVARSAERLANTLAEIEGGDELTQSLKDALRAVRHEIDRLLGRTKR